MLTGFTDDYLTALLEMSRNLLDGISFNHTYFERLLERSKSLLFWKDIQSNFIACNKKFSEVGGVFAPQHIVGKCDYDLAWHVKESDHYRLIDQEVFQLSRPRLNIEEIQHQSDGRNVVILTSKFPIYSTNQKKVGLIGVATDITEQKALEKRLLDIQQQVVASAQISEHFIGQPLLQLIDHLNRHAQQLTNSKQKYICVYQNKSVVLSPRQLQCITLLLQGKTSKEIAKTLRLSPRTIEFYFDIIKKKFSCATKPHLIAMLLDSTGYIE